MKRFLKNVLNFIGYEIKKVQNEEFNHIGKIERLLRDLKKRGLECKYILDVGANNTNWSHMAKNIFSEAIFYLIEPQVEMKERLIDFCLAYPESKFFLSGAGATTDMLTLTIWDDLAGSSLLPQPNEELKKNDKQRKIEIITIDRLLDTAQIKMPTLIKLDIQGFELEALKGASKTFGNTEVYILEVSMFEFLPNMPIFSDVINFMLVRNYVVYDFPGFLRRPIDGALGQCDICFVKKNGFLRYSNEWNSSN